MPNIPKIADLKSISSSYISHIPPEFYKPITSSKPPALTAGLCVFLTLVHICSIINPELPINWSLSPQALLDFELYRLSTYPLVHVGFIHLFLNLISIYGPLSQFEIANGTVHTGIVLNTLASFTAIPYCLIGMLFYPNVTVLGSSGWCFSMMAYFTYLKSRTIKKFRIFGSKYEIPTVSTPFIMVVLIAVFVPGSSFIGHLIAVVIGFALGMGYLAPLCNPPFLIVQRIETFLGKLIENLPEEVKYIREVEVVEKRYKIEHLAAPTLPIHHNNDTFKGTGNVLGSSVTTSS